MSSRSYILQIMLWHQSLKSIHYRTLLIFMNKKQQIGGSKHGGDKRHVIPPMSKHGGDISPPSPQDLRPCKLLVLSISLSYESLQFYPSFEP